MKLAQALDVAVKDFFLFPEQDQRHQALALLETCSRETLEAVLKLLSTDAKKTAKKGKDGERRRRS